MEGDITNLGTFLDKHDITKRDFSQESGVNERTVYQLCKDPNHFPRFRTVRKVMEVVRRIDPEAKASDFFDTTVP